jgi:hypothetical protein
MVMPFQNGWVDVVSVDPFTDIDTSYVFNPDGTVQQKIETGMGQTKTSVYTYVGGYLQSVAVVIT